MRENDSQVLLTDGRYASIANSGSGLGAETDIRNDSGVGDILSMSHARSIYLANGADFRCEVP